MEILGRRGWVAYLKYCLPRTIAGTVPDERMNGSGPAFQTVGEKHDQSAFDCPAAIGRRYVVIYNHLRSVGKVAELRFPYC